MSGRVVYRENSPVIKGIIAGRSYKTNISVKRTYSSQGVGAPYTLPGTDRVGTLYDGATFQDEASFEATTKSGQVSVVNRSPSVATLAGGQLTASASGVATVVFSDPVFPGCYEEIKQIALEAGSAVSSFEANAQSGATGSLRKHLWDQWLSCVAGKLPGSTTQDIWSDVVCGGTGVWYGAVNPTALIPSETFAHTGVAKALAGGQITHDTSCHFITRRHALYATHTGSFASVYVRKSDGSLQILGALAHTQVPGLTDISIAYFSSDLDASISVASIAEPLGQKLPFMSPLSIIQPIPIPLIISQWVDSGVTLIGTQSRHLRTFLTREIGHLIQIPTSDWVGERFADVLPWASNLDGGDSSSAAYILVYGVPILVAVASSKSALAPVFASGPLVEQMNQLAANFGDNTVYAPIVADLSMFTNY